MYIIVNIVPITPRLSQNNLLYSRFLSFSCVGMFFWRSGQKRGLVPRESDVAHTLYTITCHSTYILILYDLGSILSLILMLTIYDFLKHRLVLNTDKINKLHSPVSLITLPLKYLFKLIWFGRRLSLNIHF